MKTCTVIIILFLFPFQQFATVTNDFGKKVKSVSNKYCINLGEEKWYSISPFNFLKQVEVYRTERSKHSTYTFILRNDEGGGKKYTVDIDKAMQLFDVLDDGTFLRYIFISRRGNIEIVNISSKESLVVQNYKLPNGIYNLSKTSATLLKNNILLTVGNYKGVISINLKTGQISLTPLFDGVKITGNLIIEEAIPIDEEDTFLLISDKPINNINNENILFRASLIKFSNELSTLEAINLPGTKKYNFSNLGFFKNEDGTYLISGLYTSHAQIKREKIGHGITTTLYALGGQANSPLEINNEGLFFIKYESGKPEIFNKYNFCNFESYWRYFTERQAKYLAKGKTKQKNIVVSKEEDFYGYFKLKSGYLTLTKLCPESSECEQSVHVIAMFNTSGELVWDNAFATYSKNRFKKVEVIELENDNINIKIGDKFNVISPNDKIQLRELSNLSITTYSDFIANIVLKPDGEFLELPKDNRIIPPIETNDREFQEKGGRMGFPLTILTTHENFDGLKPFDRYHFGFDGEFHLISKPATPNTKIKWHLGSFLYGDAGSMILALAGQFSPFENSNTAFGVHSGFGLLYKNSYELGIKYSLGFGSTFTEYYSVNGLTPYITFIPNTGLNSNIYVKLEAPMWRNSVSSFPFGIYLNIGWHYQSFRKSKKAKQLKKKKQ